jgi:hypothetical protein
MWSKEQLDSILAITLSIASRCVIVLTPIPEIHLALL